EQCHVLGLCCSGHNLDLRQFDTVFYPCNITREQFSARTKTLGSYMPAFVPYAKKTAGVDNPTMLPCITSFLRPCIS
ncbi:MAG: hypothetical protein ACREVH_05475, partial [Gammaproteobacteria bacterium]